MLQLHGWLSGFQFLRVGDDALGFLDQGANALGVSLGMAVAGQRIGAAAGFNQNIRPHETRLDMDGGDLGNADADLVLAEPRTLVADDRAVGHFDDRGEKMVPPGPAAGAKRFRVHTATVIQALSLGNRI